MSYDDDRRQRAIEALGVLDTAPDERVDRVTRLAQEMFGVPMVSVTLLDHDRQWRKSEIGLGGPEAPREGAFCDATVRKGDTLLVEDASIDARFAENPFVVGDPHLRFYAGHPLRAPGGEAVGTLCILDTKPRTLGVHQQELLQDLALWVQAELLREHELDQASLVQRALLPRDAPELPGYTLAAEAIPAGQVMGDIYDWWVRDGVLRVTLADVMGKGAGPAIVAASVRASLRTEPGRPLAVAVEAVDRMLEEDVGGTGMFVTSVHAELTADGDLSVIDAGHSLAYILHVDGSWEALRSTGLPLGMGLGEGRHPAHHRLEPGDVFVCCSDGLLDVLDPIDPLAQVREVLQRADPPEAVAEAARLARAAGLSDDVTVIVIRRDR